MEGRAAARGDSGMCLRAGDTDKDRFWQRVLNVLLDDEETAQLVRGGGHGDGGRSAFGPRVGFLCLPPRGWRRGVGAGRLSLAGLQARRDPEPAESPRAAALPSIRIIRGRSLCCPTYNTESTAPVVLSVVVSAPVSLMVNP